MPEQELPLSIKGVVFKLDEGSQVLLLRNDRREWELPGGRMEGGETPETCLKREFREETGLDVAVGPCVGGGVLTITPPRSPSSSVRIRAYGCHLLESSTSAVPQVLISNEHRAWRWFPVTELASMADIPDLYKSLILAWFKQ